MKTGGAGCAVLAAALAIAAPARAILIGGGGSSSKDCLVVYDVAANFPETAPRAVRCTDGAECDLDHKVNGSCSLGITVCLNSTVDPSCTLSGVESINIDHSFDNGTDPKFDPDFLALRTRIDSTFTFPVTAADSCTDQVVFTVPIKGPLGHNHCAPHRKKLKVAAVSTPAGGSEPDNDTIKFTCEPAPGDGCDPTKLYNSTFDRMQEQIFNQNCALGGCHDSQSQSGGLLLETGAAYGNLVNHVPGNGSAAAAGWLRVDPGSVDTSFLFHKIEGDLPDSSYGLRMPRNRPKLNRTLRNIIELWIQAGAPPDTTGNWVPGTF